MKPQTRAVFKFLCRHRSITALEALNKLGVFRLAARIAELKAAGINVHSTLVTRNGKRFARYVVG